MVQPEPFMYLQADFPVFVQSHLRHRRLTVRSFARALGQSPSFVSRVLGGHRLPPLQAMDQWADILELTTHGREVLHLLAAKSHTPPRMLALVARLCQERAASESATSAPLDRYEPTRESKE
jgi:hypothetical protein